jgi:hypothetical protein
MQTHQWFPGEMVEGQKRDIAKESEEAFRIDLYAHYLDCGDGFMGVFGCKT